MEITDSLHRTPVKGKPLSPFISKLKLLLSDEKYRNAIRWSESGGAILITDGEAFKRQVLDESAEMFKTRNFTSFVRQLNLYGFRKVPVNGKGDPSKNMEFEHIHFKRDKPELMHLVHRTCSSRKKKRVAQGNLTNFKRESPSQSGGLHYGKFKLADSGKGAVSKPRRSNNSFYRKSPGSPPKPEAENEDETNYELNNSRYSSFERASANGGNSLMDYYYQKHQEEQIAVQLLLNLRYSLSTPPPNYENCQPSQTPCDPPCTGYPMYMYPTTVPFYGQYNALY